MIWLLLKKMEEENDIEEEEFTDFFEEIEQTPLNTDIEFYSKIKGIKSQYINKVVMAMIQEMSLNEFINKRAGSLSGGNKRKLAVAISFLCSPPIVLLDEPSTGMDPEARN